MPHRRPFGTRLDDVGRVLVRVVSHRRFVVGCLVGGVVLRLLWILLIRPAPVSDSRFYMETASSLAGGHGYSAGGAATAWRPPGYSLFLAGFFRLFGAAPMVASAANVVLAGVTLFLAYRLALELTRSDTLARLTLLFLALQPNFIAYSSLVASEILTLCLLTGALLLVSVAERRPLAAFAAGVAFGAAALVRPVVLLIPLVVGIARIVRSRRAADSPRATRRAVAGIVVVHVTMMAVLVPWLARNHALYGDLVFADEGGVTLLVGNNPYAGGGWRMDDRVRALVPSTGDEHRDATAAWNYAAAYAKAHALRTATLVPKKLAYLYAVDHDGAAWNRRGFAPRQTVQRAALAGVAVVADIYYWILLAATVVVVWRRRRSREGSLFPGLGVLMLAYFTLVYLPFFGTSRFHFLLAPWLCLGAAEVIRKRASRTTSANSQRLLEPAIA